jgi:hypothetical protein
MYRCQVPYEPGEVASIDRRTIGKVTHALLVDRKYNDIGTLLDRRNQVSQPKIVDPLRCLSKRRHKINCKQAGCDKRDGQTCKKQGIACSPEVFAGNIHRCARRLRVPIAHVNFT